MRAHFDAFKALLEVPPALAGKVFSTVRRTNGSPVRANYVVAFPDVPDLDDDRYQKVQSRDARARFRFDVRVVAVDGDGLLLLTDAVLQVIGKRPMVVGRDCGPVSLVPGVEEGKGRYDLTTDLYFIDLTFEVWSERA